MTTTAKRCGGGAIMTTPPLVLELYPDDVSAIAAIVATQRITDIEDPNTLTKLHLLSHELPPRIRQRMYEFARQDCNGALLINGLPRRAQPQTPKYTDSHSWHTLPEDITFHLFAALLGEPFGWASYLDGRVLHHVVPQQDLATSQTSQGSTTELLLHTEEAFHEFRPDFVGLFGYRNNEQCPTTIVQACDLQLSDEDIAMLSSRQFTIRQDDAHELRTVGESEQVSLMFGDPASPYLRIDIAYTNAPSSAPACQAYEHLLRATAAATQEVVLQPGQMLFLNNHRACHGRSAFVTNYDGKQRWLKRLWLTTDLRKSRNLRDSATSRIIH